MTFFFLSLIVFAASIVFSMMGLGGGAIYTPIQVWFGIDFHVAAATSLFLIMVTSLSATIVFHKAEKIDWPLAIALESVTALGGFAGGFYSEIFSSSLLSIIFSCVIAATGIIMLSNITPLKFDYHPKKRFYVWKREVYNEVYYVNLPLGMLIGFIAGTFSGLLGIGGGILKVPLMVMLLGIPMDIAVGTSAFMVGITALGGFSGHFLRGHWDPKTSLMLACFVFIGGQLGSRKSITTDKKRLKKGCGLLLVIIALTMLFVK